MSQRKIIEWTLTSLDGVFTGPQTARFMEYADEAYLRDGLGLLLGCDGALVGRTTYQNFASLWPGREHPWAEGMNAVRKYVFSSSLEESGWTNSSIVRGDPIAEVTKLKDQPGRDLLIWGHGRLTETLLTHGLIDVLEIAIHPFMAGQGQTLFREDLSPTMRLVAAKTFAGGIAKLTYELQPG